MSHEAEGGTGDYGHLQNKYALEVTTALARLSTLAEKRQMVDQQIALIEDSLRSLSGVGDPKNAKELEKLRAELQQWKRAQTELSQKENE